MNMSNTLLGILFLLLALVLIIILVRLLLAGEKDKGGRPLPHVSPGKIGDRPVPPGADAGTSGSGSGSGKWKGDLRYHKPGKSPAKKTGEVKEGDDNIDRIYTYQPSSDIRICRYCETENGASAGRCCVCNQYLDQVRR